MNITLPELENAINYWRSQRPATGEEGTLSPEVNVLATVYAEMIFYRASTVTVQQLDQRAQRLIEDWHAAGQHKTRSS
jgi:hypothetical protein